MRVVFMGTPEIAVPSLEALVKAGYDIAGVYTKPDKPAGRGKEVVQSPVKKLALKYGLPIFQPASMRDPAAIDRLRELAPDVILIAAYGQILPKEVLAVPRHGCINLHPSLLPKYRGPAPIAFPILNGDKETGVTITLVIPKVDAGPLLAQRRVPIEPDETTATLLKRLAREGADLFIDTLARWAKGEITPQPQDESEATFSRMISKDDGFIDWHLPAIEIERRVRAFQPWPEAFTRWHGRLLKILEASPLADGQERPPGTFLKLDPGQTGLVAGIQTGDGILGLKKVQLEGRKAMSTEEFLRGQREIVGETLPS